MSEKDSKTTPKTPEELQLEVTELQKKLEEEAQIRASVTSDPDFQRLLKAKQEGKNFKVSLGDEQEAKPEKKSMKDQFGLTNDAGATDVNDLDNKGMLNLLADAMEDFVGASIIDAVEKSGSVVDQKLSSVIDSQQKIQQAMINQSKSTGSAQMLNKYPDFEKYGQEAWKLVQTNGLQLEDAYLLAKGRSGDANLQTEQPDTPPTRGIDLSARDRGGDENRDGRPTNKRASATTRKFRQSVGDAFDRMSAKRNSVL
jgi:hypothetical protein